MTHQSIRVLLVDDHAVVREGYRALIERHEGMKVVAEALRVCRAMATPGTKTADIDRAVEELYARHGALPLFKGYPGRVPFPASTCISGTWRRRRPTTTPW